MARNRKCPADLHVMFRAMPNPYGAESVLSFEGRAADVSGYSGSKGLSSGGGGYPVGVGGWLTVGIHINTTASAFDAVFVWS